VRRDFAGSVYAGGTGIVRTVEWGMSMPPDEADRRVRDALAAAGMQPDGDPGAIRAASERNASGNGLT
jgi:hypothetical protein